MPATTMDNYIGKRPYFVTEAFPILLSRIKQYFDSPEPGVVISAPLNGMPFRINQIIQNYSQEFSGSPVHIELGVGIEDITNIRGHLTSQGYTLGKDQLKIFISNADYCLKVKSSKVISELISLQKSTKSTKIVFFFESDIKSDDNFLILNQQSLHAQTFYFPIFDELDAKRFLLYLSEIWSIEKPNKTILKKIIRLCGGHMWLLTHALREYRMNKKMDIDRMIDLPGMSFRVGLISKSFTPEEKEILTGKKIHDESSESHLRSLGIWDRKHCSIPILLDFLLEEQDNANIELINDDIHLDKVNLKHSFTDQETIVLKTLIRHRGEIVTRDEMAESIWRRESAEKYSEWAIEQLIRRLRKKLTEIGLRAQFIKTKRSVGYYVS